MRYKAYSLWLCELICVDAASDERRETEQLLSRLEKRSKYQKLEFCLNIFVRITFEGV